MTLTNVLATTEAVKTLKGMTFDPVKALEAMGYTYTEMTEDEEWDELRYTGVNPENLRDVAVVTVGEDMQYVYLEDPWGEDWRYEICVENSNVTGVYKINTPAEALEELRDAVIGTKYDDYIYPGELSDDDEVIDWNDVCTAYDLQLHGVSSVEAGSTRYMQDGFDRIDIVMLYINVADAPEVTLYASDDGTVYKVD